MINYTKQTIQVAVLVKLEIKGYNVIVKTKRKKVETYTRAHSSNCNTGTLRSSVHTRRSSSGC